MLSDLMEHAFDYLTEHGHYLQGRNISPGGSGDDPATCLLIAMNRTNATGHHCDLYQWGVIGGLEHLETCLRGAGVVFAPWQNIATWSDSTPDEEFFLTLKKAIAIARAAEEVQQ